MWVHENNLEAEWENEIVVKYKHGGGEEEMNNVVDQ